uniref:Uncharacterized protein n=1 Tax=Tetranychus urticae TaxID=32264 RepID=T1KR36_TETUR
MIELEVKKEPSETWRETNGDNIGNASNAQLTGGKVGSSSFLQLAGYNGVVQDGEHLNGTSINSYGNGGDAGRTELDDLGEEILLEERDIQIYEELLTRMRNEVIIKEPTCSHEQNCQMITLPEDHLNSAWSSFRYPRNYDDFLELIFTWADNYLNDQEWPQEEIFFKLRNYAYAPKYTSFKFYSQAYLSNLVGLFYAKLKKETSSWQKSSKYIKDKGVIGTVDTVKSEDQWSEIVFKLLTDLDTLKFGNCCVLSVVDSYNSSDRLYFGSILGKDKISIENRKLTLLTVKVFEFVPVSGDKFALLSLFRTHHIYTSAECLFKLETSQYLQHYLSPSLKSGPSGVQLRLDEKTLTDFDRDAIFKAVDTFSLSIPDISPVSCIDFREMDTSLKDLTDFVVEILLAMRSAPLDIRWINLDIPALVISKDEDILSSLHEKFKKADFSIYRIGSKSSPINLREKIPMVSKALAKAFSRTKFLEDAPEYEKLVEQWDFVDEGIFQNDEQKKLYNELTEVAKIFALRNSAVVLGNIYDVCNDLAINSSLCQIPVCLILGASSIPECFTLPLMKYGCEKFILIDREITSGTKSLFNRLVSIYEEEQLPVKGAKCCIVTNVKKKVKIPEPPKVSRHKIIEESAKDSASTSSTTPGYNPEQRKNPRNRMPYCPKPTANPTNDSNK